MKSGLSLIKSQAASGGTTITVDAQAGTYIFVGHSITRGRSGESSGTFSSSGTKADAFSTNLGTSIDNSTPRCSSYVGIQTLSSDEKISFSWSGGSGYATAELRIYKLS